MYGVVSAKFGIVMVSTSLVRTYIGLEPQGQPIELRMEELLESENISQAMDF